MTTYIAHGKRTALRPVASTDLNMLTQWLSQPDVYRWWGGHPLTREIIAMKYLGNRRPKVESFIIEAAGNPIGYIQYWSHDMRSGGLDMFLAPSAQGRGLGPDAARAIVRHLKDTRGWDRITVDPAIDNVNAIRAWAKAGFRVEREVPDRPDGPAVLMAIELVDSEVSLGG
jgi:aminoglycoside 6'-N-acetyltransferase